MLEKTTLIFQSLVAPRKTYRAIQEKPERDASLLLTLILSMSVLFSELINPERAVGLKIALLAGGIVLTVISVILLAHLINWISGFFSNLDASNDLRLAIPYTFVPGIIVNFLSAFAPLNSSVLLGLKIVSSIWLLALLTALVSELKKIDGVRAFVSVLLASVITSLPIIVYKIIIPAIGQ